MFFIHVWSDVTCVSAYGQLQTEGRLHLSLNFWTVTKGLRRKGAPWTWTPLWECNRQGVTPGCEPALSAPGGCAGGRRPSTLLLPVRLPCRRLAQGPPSALPTVSDSLWPETLRPHSQHRPRLLQLSCGAPVKLSCPALGLPRLTSGRTEQRRMQPTSPGFPWESPPCAQARAAGSWARSGGLAPQSATQCRENPAGPEIHVPPTPRPCRWARLDTWLKTCFKAFPLSKEARIRHSWGQSHQGSVFLISGPQKVLLYKSLNIEACFSLL